MSLTDGHAGRLQAEILPNRVFRVFAVLFVLTAAPPARALPAFPGAEGWGSETPGGRGGRVIAVTNLNDSGPGSLREAVTAKGPRNVVFRVSGTIRLKSHLRVTEPFITIAGQTAPGDGICLRDAGLYVQTHDVVIRYIRSRVGDSLVEEFDTQDALQISDDAPDDDNGVYNIVIDHCSFSWSIDECVGIRVPAHDVTFSWNIVSEALRQPFTKEQIGKERSHSMSLILSGGPTRCSLHHNLLALCNSRNPRIQGGRHAFVNNVVYGWGWLTGTFSRNPEVNFIGNLYKPGPASMDLKPVCETEGQMGRLYVDGNRLLAGPSADRLVFTADAQGESSLPAVQGALNEWERTVNTSAELHRVEAPFEMPPLSATSALEAYDHVLAQAGATLPKRDAVDRRVVRYTRLGMGEKIDRPADVGGYPELKTSDVRPDSDGDGMPDDWEIAMGFDPADPSDGAGDADRDGYTNFEEYLNWLVENKSIPRPSIGSASASFAGAPFTVMSGDRKLTVLPADDDGRTFYTNAYVEGEVDITVTTTGAADLGRATFAPPRFADHHLRISPESIRFRVNEAGTRVISLSNDPDALRLWLFFNEHPQDAPRFGDPNIVDVRNYGIMSGSNITEKLQAALDDASKIPGGGVVWIPDGQHEIDTVRIPSDTTLYVAATAVLHANPRHDGPLILFDGVSRAGLTGPGCITDDRSAGVGRPTTVSLIGSERVTISEIVLKNRAHYTLLASGCRGVQLRATKILARHALEGMGIRAKGCQDVTCERSFIAGGIGIIIDSESRDPASIGLAVTESVIDGAHMGIALRSEGASCRDILFRDVDIIGERQGIHVRSQASGSIERLVFRDTTLHLDHRLEWRDAGIRPLQIQSLNNGFINDVLFDRVALRASAKSTVSGTRERPITDVKFWGVRVHANDRSRERDDSTAEPLFELKHVRDPQFRFLYVTWPMNRAGWSSLFEPESVEGMKAPDDEVFETAREE